MAELEKIREIFSRDRYATENGMVIDDASEHYAKCSVTLTQRHRNAMGGVMGGVHFTLADFAFAVASNQGDERTVALSTDISYTAPVRGERLIAEAKLIKNGRSTCFYTVEVSDDLGNLVAVLKCVGYHVAK
ncbi:MAG: PaaI family thioesterase [Ruminiclostridium sp.]|nr:PaaI family thioesterase [Ruminiclostridium sp.]